jgi:hypothetical protein
LPSGFDPTVWGISSSINDGYPYLLAVPPAPDGLSCPLKVDCKYVARHEGGLFLYPYLPASLNANTNTWVVRGNSGVTVSIGVDLGAGQITAADLADA